MLFGMLTCGDKLATNSWLGDLPRDINANMH